LLTNVYGHADSTALLDSLLELQSHVTGAWIISGDFNLIRHALDKNNPNINWALCSLFNSTISSLALLELPLLDRKYTWSNRRKHPTLERIDRVFFNTSMNALFPNSSLTSQGPPYFRPHITAHPALLAGSKNLHAFRFKNSWLLRADFLPKVLPAWVSAVVHHDAAGALAAGLKAVRREAKVWAKAKRSLLLTP
jgi:hypothetical protein